MPSFTKNHARWEARLSHDLDGEEREGGGLDEEVAVRIAAQGSHIVARRASTAPPSMTPPTAGIYRTEWWSSPTLATLRAKRLTPALAPLARARLLQELDHCLVSLAEGLVAACDRSLPSDTFSAPSPAKLRRPQGPSLTWLGRRAAWGNNAGTPQGSAEVGCAPPAQRLEGFCRVFCRSQLGQLAQYKWAAKTPTSSSASIDEQGTEKRFLMLVVCPRTRRLSLAYTQHIRRSLGLHPAKGPHHPCKLKR